MTIAFSAKRQDQSSNLFRDYTISQLLRAWLEHVPDAIALTAPGRAPLSYRQLLGQVELMAASLQGLGVSRRDRVAVVLPTGPEMAVAFLAVSSGAVFAPLNPACRENEFEFYLLDLKAKALIVQSGIDSPAISVARRQGIRMIEITPWLEAEARLSPPPVQEKTPSVPRSVAEPDDVALVLYTSGTTLKPKRVPLTHRNLCASADSIKTTLQLSRSDRCLNLMPLFHIHGLVGGLLSSLAAGASVAVPERFDADHVFQWMEELQPTWYTAVPTIHHAILREARSRSRTHSELPLRFIRSSSAPLPAKLMADLEEFFEVPVIEAYGMTEATHQITSNPLPPDERKSGSVGLPAGSEVEIMDEEGNLLATGQIGEIVLRGLNVTRGYEENTEANRAAFTDGWFRTGDQGYLDADGYLFIVGRIKEIINRGGEKISPQEVEAVLMEHPAISEAVAFPVAHETLGEDVAAAVVPKPNASITASDLQSFALSRLPGFKIPRRVAIVDRIPKGPTGKVQRIKLAEQLGLEAVGGNESPTRPKFVAPRTVVETTLAEIWREILGVDQVGIHDNFFDLGGHSISCAQVINRVRSTLGAELSFQDFFDTPTVAGLAGIIETTSRARHISALNPVVRPAKLPLSFAQQRLWFFDQLEPGNPVYNCPVSLRITGQLHVEVLERCLNEIVRRHEALRASFAAHGGEAEQRIAANWRTTLTVVDLVDVPEVERQTEALRRAVDASRQPFDLAKGPLLRTHLIRLGGEDHLLLWVTHHIVFDGWSDRVLHRDLTLLYNAFIHGEPSPLRELPIQYADYTLWQAKRLEGGDWQRDLAYWKEQLENIPALLNLPTDRPRPAVQSYWGARKSFTLPLLLSAQLRELSRREGVTLFMTLLAAFKTLLFRYSGQVDILVGVPTAGRSRVETEHLLGVFINTLVLRTDLSGNPSFRELLHRVRETALGAYTHQDVSFEKLVEVLHPDRELSHSPLFQVMFALRNLPDQDVVVPGLKLDSVDLDIGVAKFDLTVEIIHQRDGGLECRLEYDTDLFDDATVERMWGHFRTLLEGIVADPGQRISDLPLLTEAERHQLLVEWNDTKKDYPADKCISQLFEEQAEKTPDAIAVVFEDEQLTYRELNGKANQLGHYLREQGVGPDFLVGICVERSLEMVVGLLGILKAGGAYVPLDPEYPKERLVFQLKDTKTAVLLTQERLLGALPEHDVRVVCLDRDWAEIARESNANPESGATAANLAYVIYTSGSTGKPKGVMIQHASLVNYLLGFNDHSLGQSLQTLPTTTKPTFDASLKQLFAPFLRGDQVWIIPEEVAQEPVKVYQALASSAGVSLNCVGSFWHAILSMINSSEIIMPAIDLSSLLLGGESISSQLVERTFSMFPRVALWNLYGPTEATAHATIGRIVRGGRITLGRPLPNVEIFILDSRLQPVPIGVPGELYIGGKCLARGYLNRPDLTAEKFITHSFDGEPARRLYETGDLARYLSDGNIEFLGRIDNQVKIRGCRIELGEIESVLSQCPGVWEVVVVAREDTPGDKRLVAYVVGDETYSLQTGELRGFLKAKLPEYMIPSAFMFLDALPLTPNGKIDRRSLPAPDRHRDGLKQTYVAPRSPTEEILAGIWAEVLKVERVGIHDNFFDLGGHSLLATQVISRLRVTLQMELPLRFLFEYPTVAGLADRIEETRRQERGLQSCPVQSVSRTKDLPLSFSQQRLWFLDQYEPESSVYNIPSAIRLTGALDVSALERSLQEIVNRHEALRTTFSVVEGEAVQVIAPSLKLALPVVDLSETPEAEREEEAQRLAQEEARRPFDLSRGPLFRIRLLQLGKEDHVLLMTLHHIVSDGWSMAVMHHELSVLYQAFSNSQPSPLPDLPIQYADYAVWQREWLKGEELERQISYWKKQLEGITPLQLPTDRPRPPVQTHRGARQSLSLPKELTEKLQSLSRKEGVTLYMTLLAAFQTLLHRYSGREDIVVGSPIAGRNRSEIEGLIGFFVNTLALRSNFSGNPTFKQLLARVKEMALGAYAHQELPFEKLVEELHPERDLSHSPLFQVMFVLQNTTGTALKLGGVAVSPMRVGGETAKLDLTLSLSEGAEGLRGSVEYSTDLFEDGTISRMLGHLQVLLEGIVADLDRPISALPVLTEAERHQLLVEWNDTNREFPKDKSIHQLFEEQVERTPDAVAVVFENERLTYRELNQRANQLAHYLRKLGVGPEVLVGICIERSLEMVIGLLGILKAGGAYVPLDPAYPKERLAFMVEDAHAKVVLTQQKLVDGFPAQVAHTICLDRDWQAISKESVGDPEGKTTGADTSYVIYTSGSTGRPKGVAVPHEAVNRLVINADYIELKSDDVVAQVSNCSFDAATFEIWGALLNGARLVIITRDVVLAPQEFTAELKRHGVTTLFLTTALFNLVARQVPDALASLRQVLFGGEAVEPRWVAELLRQGRPERLLHVYGPTEATTFATWQLVGEVAQGAATVPIGRPIANTQVYMLDDHRHPVPVGVPGELYIGGDGLARGYLNRPELTAERFIPNPFSAESGARLYKTGDLGRFLPDGNIEFLGRIDNQVKLRGFRIELDEIEAVLSQHPGVKEIVVAAREDVPGQKRLVAYGVPAQEWHPTASELRGFLQHKLPDYMIPSAYVFLNSLPLTPNGKIDRHSLPAPDRLGDGLEQAYVAPRSPTEEILAGIWAEVLKLDQVGIYDNFFSLGGHSLLAVRLITEIERIFNKRLHLALLFQYPTVEQLAGALLEKSLPGRSSLVPIQPIGSKPPFFFVHGDYAYADFAPYLELDRPFYGLAQHLDGGKVRGRRIEQMANHYIRKVRAVQPEGPYYIGGHSVGALVAFEMAQQLHKDGQKIALLALLEPATAGDSVAAADHRSIRSRVRQFRRRTICELYHLLNKSLPPKLESFYVQKIVFPKIYKQAGRNYRPKAYPGRVVYFKAREDTRDSAAIWQRVAQGGLEVYHVSGDHMSILLDPHVRDLCEKLTICLSKAQADKDIARDTVETWLPTRDTAAQSIERWRP